MPSPSDLEWWAWLLIAAGGGIAASLICVIADAWDDQPLVQYGGFLLSAVIALGAILSAAIGAVRLAKWAWGG